MLSNLINCIPMPWSLAPPQITVQNAHQANEIIREERSEEARVATNHPSVFGAQDFIKFDGSPPTASGRCITPPTIILSYPTAPWLIERTDRLACRTLSAANGTERKTRRIQFCSVSAGQQEERCNSGITKVPIPAHRCQDSYTRLLLGVLPRSASLA